MGGKIERLDPNIYYTAARQAAEESNGVVVTKRKITNLPDIIPYCTQVIYDQITNLKCQKFYNNKYLLCVVELAWNEAQYISQDKLLWKTIDDYLLLHPRIHNTNITHFLKSN